MLISLIDPNRGSWDAAAPKRITSSENNKSVNNKESLSIRYEISNEIGNDTEDQEIQTQVQDLLYSFNPMIEKSLEVAAHLYKGAVYPQEHLVPDSDPVYMGTHIDDKDVLAVCEEAADNTGAEYSAIYFFSEQPFPGQENESEGAWQIRPPTCWGGKNENDPLWEKILGNVKDVSIKKAPSYSLRTSFANKEYYSTLLPLEFSSASTGTLVLTFSYKREFSELVKCDLERLIPRWVYRISMHQLIWQNRFSKLMTTLRVDILSARKKTEAQESSLPCSLRFTQKALAITASHTKATIALLSITKKAPSSPDRLERFWFVKDNDGGESGYHVFLHASLSGLCKEVIDLKRPVIYSDSKIKKTIESLIKNLEEEIETVEGKDDRESVRSLQDFLAFLKGIEQKSYVKSTAISFPVMKREDKKDEVQGVITLIFPGNHFFDGEQRKHWMELGYLLGEHFALVNSLDQDNFESRLQDELEVLRREFSKSYQSDEIISSFVQKLTLKKEKSASEDKQPFALSSDLLMWGFFDKANLAPRWIQGEPLDLSAIARRILPLEEHPIYSKLKEQIFQYDEKEKYPALKEGAYRMWTIPLNSDSETNELLQHYGEVTKKKWLLTFPVVNAGDRILGFIDCLRDDPLPIEREAVFGRILQRAASQFSEAVTSSHFLKLQKTSNDLFSNVEPLLLQFKSQQIFQTVVQMLREVFSCEHCDLFLEQDSEILLHATTRFTTPLLERERTKYRVKSAANDTNILSHCLQTGNGLISHHRTKKKDLSKHMSTELLRKIHFHKHTEGMVIPLLSGKGSEERKVGLLYFEGPTRYERGVKEERNRLFAKDDFLLGKDLSKTVQMIVQMVNLSVQQGWLVNELTHSMGQPLQVLYSDITTLFREIRKVDSSGEIDIQSNFEKIKTAFDVVAEARSQLDTFATRLSQKEDDFNLEQIFLGDLLKNCCDLMSIRDRVRKNRISYEINLKRDSIPLVAPMMRKAILNLLDNALKYSWEFRDIFVLARENSEGSIVIKFTNRGIGIPKEHERRIFDPYFRSMVADSKDERRGTGVGLTIVKDVIEEVHRGKIQVECKPLREIPEEKLNDIRDIEHETTFTIFLQRKELMIRQLPKNKKEE